MSDHETHEHDLGLSHDLPTIVERHRLGRRRLLRLVGGAGVAVAAGGALAACGSDDAATTLPSGSPPGGGAPGSGQGGAPAGGTEASVEVAEGEIPEETAGPYPGDGSNGVNALSESGVVRSDLTRSFGDASGVAQGVPATVRLKVYDLSGTEVTPLAGAAIYLWHCDRAGRYSMYDEEIQEENYCRGVQVADADGQVEFTTIFPACYDGRWPHFHFEVYESLASATSYTNKLRTSQIALPQEVCEAVYATEGYDASVANLARTSLERDMVFADGHSLQMAAVTGSVESGYTVVLNVPV